jgi:hypothetical protein
MSSGAIREQDDVNAALDELHLASQRLAGTTAEARAALARQCLTGVAQVSDEWARTTAAAKGLEADSPWIGEELATGPMAIARQLQLLAASLEGFARTGTSPLPGAPHQDGRGRLRVPVLPVKGLYDGIAFKGFTAEVVMEEGILEEHLPDHTARSLRRPETGVSLVLGAGNVSSIAVADTIEHVLAEGQPTALKLASARGSSPSSATSLRGSSSPASGPTRRCGSRRRIWPGRSSATHPSTASARR